MTVAPYAGASSLRAGSITITQAKAFLIYWRGLFRVFLPLFVKMGINYRGFCLPHSLLKSFEGGLAYAFHAFELLHQSLCSDLPDPLY